MTVSRRLPVVLAWIVLGAGLALAQQLSGEWSRRAPMADLRTEPGTVALDGKLYVIGGSTKAVDDLATALVYDPATDTWADIATMPRGLNHVSAVAAGGKVYAVGGFSGRVPGSRETRRVHQGAEPFVFAYDPRANSWSTMAPLSAPRGSVGVAVVDGKIHAIGGRGLDVKTVPIHEVFDPATGKWSEAAPLPRKRDHMAVIAARGLIHVIGGRTDDRDDNVGDHDIYDPATNSWRSAPPLPTPRSGGQSALIGNLIIVYGGENSKKTFDEVEAFDLDQNIWLSLPRAPTGLHASAGASIGDTIYFPGGSTGPGGDGTTAQLLTLRLK